MTKKFDELYENIKIGFPISVQNPSREVPYTLGYDMGQELNDEELAHVDDLINNNGRLTNPHNPLNLKVRSYMNQLQVMSTEELMRLAELIGMKDAHVYHDDDVVKAIVNHLGEDPANWKILSPYIFTESEDEDDDLEESEDDSEWVSQKSHDDNWMAEDEDDDDDDDSEDDEDEDDEDELDERIVKSKKFRKGKLTIMKKTNKPNFKTLNGKEVKMKPKEIKNRKKAAVRRERKGDISRKRRKSFKKTMKVRKRKFN